MSIYDKVMAVAMLWFVLLAIYDPWLDDRRVARMMAGCVVVFSITILVRP